VTVTTNRVEEAFREMHPELLRFATVLAGPSAADDVVSLVFVSALGSQHAMVDDFRPYLFRAVLNRVRTEHRGLMRRQRREFEVFRDSATDDQTIIRFEIVEAMKGLTVRQRAVIFSTYWLDLDASTAAALLGVSTRTLERELFKAKSKLEVLLK
jgi:RNA polymerase sigma factor (sigma-70 family)